METGQGLGGTCVNVGFIPKKLMHISSLCRETQVRRAFRCSLFTVPLSWPSCHKLSFALPMFPCYRFFTFCIVLPVVTCFLPSLQLVFSGALHQKHGSKQTLTAQVLQVLLWKFQVDAHGMGWETKSSHSSDLRNSGKAGLVSDWKGERTEATHGTADLRRRELGTYVRTCEDQESDAGCDVSSVFETSTSDWKNHIVWNYVPSLQWLYGFHKAPIDFVGSMFLTCSSWHQYLLQQTRLVFHGDAGEQTWLMQHFAPSNSAVPSAMVNPMMYSCNML